MVELDGGQHGESEQAKHDADRTRWLTENDFRVLRFWDHEVLKQLDVVREAIAEALRVNTPHPNLLPQGEKD